MRAIETVEWRSSVLLIGEFQAIAPAIVAAHLAISRCAPGALTTMPGFAHNTDIA